MGMMVPTYFDNADAEMMESALDLLFEAICIDPDGWDCFPLERVLELRNLWGNERSGM